jgi:hypothetical protein
VVGSCAECSQRFDGGAEIGQCLRRFARGNHESAHQQIRARFMQGFAHTGRIQRRDGGIADQQHMTAADMPGQCGAIAQKVRAYGD